MLPTSKSSTHTRCNNLRNLKIYVIAMFVFACQILSADLNNLNGNTISRADVNQLLQQLTESNNVPGIALAIINEDGVVYQNSVGVKNVETGESLDDDSVFEAASLSKPLFAYYVMKLVEQGVIDLEKPLFDYLPHPGFEEQDVEAAKTINARMVLSHTTGMPNWSNGKKISLSNQPGEGFSYSGEAFQYLTAVIGTSQNMGWGDQLDAQINELVFQPLNMKHSSFVWNEALATRKVYGHKDGNPTDNKSIGNGKTVGGAYSLHSTIGDYAKFIHALLKQQGLTPKTMADMLAQQVALPDDHDGRKIGQVAWSLGMAIKQTDSGRRYVHTGNNHDFQSYMEFDPQSKVGVVYFTNSNMGDKVYESLSTLLEL